MEIAQVYPTVLILAAFLCSLVAGFLFAFAVVVMPGIRGLNDREFIRAFQVMDGVIQNSQPMFVIVWAGSIVVLLLSAALGFGQLDQLGQALIVVATIVYLFGVQLPTFKTNIPLNNKLQAYRLETMNEADVEAARKEFEPRWNRWNVARTILSSLTSVLLIILVCIL